MDIKPLKSELKVHVSELMPEVESNIGLKEVDTNIVIQRLEANIKLRETPLHKRKFTLE